MTTVKLETELANHASVYAVVKQSNPLGIDSPQLRLPPPKRRRDVLGAAGLARACAYCSVRKVLLFLLAFSAACAQVAPKFPTNAPPSPTSGYVGGLFSKDTVVGFGLRVENEQSKQTYLLEVEDDAVGLIAVRPGTYRVVSWVTWALTGEILTETAIPWGDPINSAFYVAAGHVTLLGRWSADRLFLFVSNEFTLKSIPIAEDEAIRAFQAAYPRFVGAPVLCELCAP
jgi:hypothetical protein